MLHAHPEDLSLRWPLQTHSTRWGVAVIDKGPETPDMQRRRALRLPEGSVEAAGIRSVPELYGGGPKVRS